MSPQRPAGPVIGRAFDPDCRRCARLARFLREVSERHPDYHCGPVPSFGDPRARLLVVGLAPGLHGANRTGRPFTGDHAGILLYATLHRFGFSNQPGSVARGDGLELADCRITNAVRCLPPANKPTTAEIRQCNAHLKAELAAMSSLKVIVVLGAIAHQALLWTYGLKPKDLPFGHNLVHNLPDGRILVTSYHCSGYNWRTGRLTRESFEAVFAGVRTHLS